MSNKDDIKETTTSEGETPAEEAVASGEQAIPAITAEELGALLEKLDEATAEINSHKERYLRTVADLENYRKRAVREKEEARKQGICSLLEDFLPVLDHFKLGLNLAEENEGGKVFSEGFRMILVQMESVLKQNGLEEIRPENDAFDPNFHESIAHQPSDTVEDGHILEVHRIGYKINERLLRPAQVVVSSGKSESKDA
ncbi:MAG: nucleotide exchange factor GrpE [Opitutales bacterium]|jgi:molecular chaperone GrpE